MVICKIGFRDVNLAMSQTFESLCPLCNQEVQPIKPGFNNCFWKISASKTRMPGNVFSTPWRRAGDSYTTYDEATAGMAEFSRFQIQVRPLDKSSGNAPPPHCRLCFGEVSEEDLLELPCGHSFHRECWIERKENLGGKVKCPCGRLALKGGGSTSNGRRSVKQGMLPLWMQLMNGSSSHDSS